MASTAQKNAAPSQHFIEIVDIIEDIVILAGSNACLVIEVKATNFALLSAEEQDAKIAAYASLLNALSFSIQIVIRSKKLDVSNYLKLLDAEKAKAQSETLAKQMGLYRNFVQELVKVNTILDKKFYIVIPYSSLEKGVIGAGEALANSSAQSNFILGAKTTLHSKADAVHTQLNRLNLKAETLGKEKLTKLFYDIFNDQSVEHHQTENVTKPMVLGKENNNARS
jgi:hypothetical protein